MFEFQGIDGVGRTRHGFVWTGDVADWVQHLRRSNWQQLRVHASGVLVAGIAVHPEARRTPVAWWSPEVGRRGHVHG